MRKLGLLMLVASLALIGIAVQQGSNWFKVPTFQDTSAAALPATPAAAKKPKAVHSATARNSPLRPAVPATTNVPPIPPDPGSTTAIVKPQLPIPDSEKMEIGSTRSEIRERYGVPTLSVSSVRDGSLVEHYYYVKPDRTNLVVATLREGRLVSAQTAHVWNPQRYLTVPSAQ